MLDEETLTRLHNMRWNSSGNENRKFRCPKCQDQGYYLVTADGMEFARECECGKVKMDKMGSKLKFAEIPKEFRGYTVESFRTDCYGSPEAVARAEMAKTVAAGYVRNFLSFRELGKGLYLFSGTKGSGKTRLAASVGNDLMREHGTAVKFATTLQVLDCIKSTWGKKSEVSESQLVKDITEVPALILDDIGVENPGGWVDEKFYSILNGRMTAKRVTIFTSNCSVDQLGLDGRVVDRIRRMALPIEFPAESVRAKLAGIENRELLEKLLEA